MRVSRLWPAVGEEGEEGEDESERVSVAEQHLALITDTVGSYSLLTEPLRADSGHVLLPRGPLPLATELSFASGIFLSARIPQSRGVPVPRTRRRVRAFLLVVFGLSRVSFLGRLFYLFLIFMFTSSRCLHFLFVLHGRGFISPIFL